MQVPIRDEPKPSRLDAQGVMKMTCHGQAGSVPVDSFTVGP